MTIDLNIDDIISEFSLPTNIGDFIVKDTVTKITDEIFRVWQLQASNGLGSTRNEYVNNLQIINNNDYSKTILLTGKLPNMLEKGCSSFDMKDGFEKSSKVKYSYRTDKNGNLIASWYLTVPFRIGTPGIIGENSAFSSVMPDEIYGLVSKLPSGDSLKKSDIPSPYDIPSSRKAINLPNRTIPEYQHKHSIYEGLGKKTAAYGRTAQNTYVAFRRVSGNSDSNSWIHKGIQAKDFMNKTLQEVDLEMISENNVDRILKDLGYGD